MVQSIYYLAISNVFIFHFFFYTFKNIKSIKLVTSYYTFVAINKIQLILYFIS